MRGPVVRRTTAVIGGLIIAASCVFAWLRGVPTLEEYASARAQRPSSAARADVDVQFIDLPAWVNADLQTRLTLTAREQLTGDPLARRDLQAAGEALFSTGWFDRVEQVRRLEADRVEVHARMADPFALIRDAQRDHLVDRDGRLLPYSVPPGAASRLVVITGARFKRPTQLRQPWEGDDVDAALHVLRLIDDRPWRGQIREVDVSRDLTGPQRLRLRTDRDTAIVWGRAPGDERAAEVPATQKISYLDRLHARTGRIDGGFPTEIDVSGDRVSIPAPMVAAEPIQADVAPGAPGRSRPTARR